MPPVVYDLSVDCLFCRIFAGREHAHILVDDGDVTAMLAMRPTVEGHVLVVPRPHVKTIGDVPLDLLARMFGVVQALERAMPAALGAEGMAVVMNNTVGQSVPHAHVHVMPRREGDELSRVVWPRHQGADSREFEDVAARLREALTRR